MVTIDSNGVIGDLDYTHQLRASGGIGLKDIVHGYWEVTEHGAIQSLNQALIDLTKGLFRG